MIEKTALVSAAPLIVALDGRSGVGKSTLARWLVESLPARVIEGDDFYAGGIGILGDPPQSRAARCIDWLSQREVLFALQRLRPARYHAFDWDAFDGSRQAKATEVLRAPIILLEGVYSARPELTDVLDLRILARVQDDLRQTRLAEREGGVGPWERQWHEAEDWYFASAAPAADFDLVVDLG